MAVRIAVSALVIVMCMLCGRTLAMRKIREADRVRRMQEDIKKLKNRTMDKRLPLSQALLTMEGEVYGRMAGRMKEDGNLTLSEAFEAEGGEGDGYRDENTCIRLLFDSLEALGRAQQEAEYERALKDLKKSEERKRLEGREKIKLYSSLGAVAGICAVIFAI